MNTKKFTLTAMFTALTCVATMVIKFPSFNGSGYINMGDAVLLLCSFLLGPVPGMIAGGLGAMLADLFLGYGQYAAATLVIKALMGLTAGVIVKKNPNLLFTVIAAIAAELIMIFGYFLFEATLLGNGFAIFLTSVLGNLIQAGAGIIVSVILYSVLRKNKYIISQIK